MDEVSQEGPLASVKKALAQPCVRTALLWGIATGTVAAAHRLRTTGSGIKAGDLGMGMFAASSGVSWFLCKRQLDEKMSKVKEAMANLNDVKEVPKNLPDGVRMEEPAASGMVHVKPQPGK